MTERTTLAPDTAHTAAAANAAHAGTTDASHLRGWRLEREKVLLGSVGVAFELLLVVVVRRVVQEVQRGGVVHLVVSSTPRSARHP